MDKRYLKNIDSVIAAIIGFYAIHLFTWYSGVGISPDSIMYASTATNIQGHGSLLTFNGTPLVFFPVFYPFFLGIIQFVTRVDPIKAGAGIDACLFAAVIFTTGVIISKFVAHSRIYKWLILIAVILSPGLLEIYTYLWSETLFILEILFFMIAYREYQLKHTTKALLWVAVITAISCITRYAGVTIIGAGGLMLLLDNELPIRKKWQHILVFGAISVSLLIANLVLNHISTGLSTGTREPAITPFVKNLYFVGSVICDWGSLPAKVHNFSVLIGAIIFLSLIGILAWKTYKSRINTYENIVIAFALVYGLFIVISASISRYEQINNRLLAPMFIPLLIACTSWVPDVVLVIRAKTKYVLALITFLLMLAFEFASYQTDAQRYEEQGEYGVPGYTDDDWNKAEFVQLLKKHLPRFDAGIPIYTDADEAVYLFSGISSKLLPHRYFGADVKKFYEAKRFYLIWFDNLANPEIISLKDIVKYKKLVKIASAKDGQIYYCDGN